MNLIFNFINSHASRLWNHESNQSIEDHDACKKAQHARQTNTIGDSTKCECSQDGSAFSRRGGNTVCRATNAGWEDFYGYEPGCAVRAHVEDKLWESEDGHQPADAYVIGYAGPDGVQNSGHNACVELLASASQKVR